MYLLPLRPGKARLVARVTARWQGCFLSSYLPSKVHRAFLPSPQGASRKYLALLPSTAHGSPSQVLFPLPTLAAPQGPRNVEEHRQ